MSLETYVNSEYFWKSIIQQAVSANETGIPVNKDPRLFYKKMAKCITFEDTNEKIEDLRKLVEYCDSDQCKVPYIDDQIEVLKEVLEKNLDVALITLVRLSHDALYHIHKTPKIGYHVSGLDASEFDKDNLDSFVLNSSDCGAHTPGVYCAPYADIGYAGGDIKRRNINVPVIFEVSLDEKCLVWSVNHVDIAYYPVEISTQYRDVSGFTDLELISIHDSPIPIVSRGENFPYTKAILVKGGKIVDNRRFF